MYTSTYVINIRYTAIAYSVSIHIYYYCYCFSQNLASSQIEIGRYQRPRCNARGIWRDGDGNDGVKGIGEMACGWKKKEEKSRKINTNNSERRGQEERKTHVPKPARVGDPINLFIRPGCARAVVLFFRVSLFSYCFLRRFCPVHLTPFSASGPFLQTHVKQKKIKKFIVRTCALPEPISREN